MSFLSKFATAAGAGVIEAVGNAIDKNFTTDEEKIEMENEIAKASMNYEIEMKKLSIREYEVASRENIAIDQETTKRWVSDNNSSFIQRMVRPLSLIFLIIVYSIMAFSATALEIQPIYAEGYQNLLMVVVAAYFGARTIEKVQGKSNWQKHNSNSTI